MCIFHRKLVLLLFILRELLEIEECFLKSCGEGKGPNNNPELLEFNIACRLLLEDSKYDIWEDKNQSMLFVPKEDISLPAYYYCSLLFLWKNIIRGQ